jgi:hypothetical protein
MSSLTGCCDDCKCTTKFAPLIYVTIKHLYGETKELELGFRYLETSALQVYWRDSARFIKLSANCWSFALSIW